MQVPGWRSVLIALIACACDAWGGGVTLQRGVTLEATGPVTLRDAPPEQRLGVFVESPGQETHTLPGGTKVKVEAVGRIKVPFDTHTWVKVRTEKGAEGWAYYGKDDSAENFKLK